MPKLISMKKDSYGFPIIPAYLRTRASDNSPIYEGLTMDQLRECREWNEAVIAICHPESPFVPLCKRDMEVIDKLIKKLL
jgi:hypothetical protein